MKALAHALQNLSDDSNFGEMIAKSVKKTKIVRKTKKWTKNPTKDKVKLYHKRLKKSVYLGAGSLRPCSLLAWRPGWPVLAYGKPGRIKWGLTDGRNDFVVMVYDHPQPLYGTNATTEYGCVPVSSLEPCNCAGYLHGKHCRPKK